MNPDPFTGHWTSIDSGRSSAAVFSNQSLTGQDAGARDRSQLDHLSSELDVNNAAAVAAGRAADQSLKQWLPTMQDLFSPSNSSASGEHFGLSAANSDQQALPKLFHSQPDDYESQMLQLKLDGNSLKRQNKQLKDRCQHYQRLNDQMKHQMKNDSSGFYHKLHESLIGKIISAKQNQTESAREDLEECVSQMQKEIGNLRDQNAALERELDVSRDTDWKTALPSKENAIQISAYKDELMRIRRMFESSEEKRRRDLEKWRDDIQQMDQLRQLTDGLHKALQEAEEHKTSQKLVAAVEQRLKQLELSLAKERQDRATGLSTVEERLLMENAKLQISEKEAQRHLNQTISRLKCLENRYLEAKKLLESHDLETLDDLSAVYKTDASTRSALERGLDRHPSRRLEMTTDDEMKKKFRDALQQITDMETVFRQRSHELLMEKNQTSAQLQNLQDINDALKVENQSLRSSLASPPSLNNELSSANSALELQTNRDQVKVLESELRAAVDQIGRLSEANQHADALLKKLEEIPMTGESLRPERLQERETIRTPFLSPKQSRHHDNEQRRERTFGHSSRKKRVDDEKHSQYTDLLVHLVRSKMAATEAEFLHFDESEHLNIEGALEEKDSQLLKLNLECDELRTELDFARKSLSHQTDNNERLQQQVEQLRSQLRQQSRLIESLSMTEQDLQMELNTVKQRLSVANKELLDREAQVKSMQLLREVMPGGSGQLEKRSPWKEVNSTSSDTVDTKTDELDFEDRVTLAKLSATLVQLQFEKQNVDDSLQKANATIEMMVRENAELKHRFQQLQQQLSNERSMVCRLTYDKMAAQQQFYAVDEECDGLRRMKERLEVEVIRQETNSLRLTTLLDLHRHQMSLKLDARFNKVTSDLKRTSAELRSTKQLLSTREKDILLLQNTVELMLKYDEASSVH